MNATGRQCLGFTLVEMMFSLALGTMILLLAAVVLGWSGEGYSRTNGGVSTGREGRALFARLGADLASAVFVDGELLESESSRATAPGIAFLTLLPAAAQSEEGHIGDACAVSYRLADLEMGGRTRRCLVRGVWESGETFAALRKGNFEGLLGGEVPATEPLAFGVVSFEAEPKWSAADGAWSDWTDDGSGPPDALEITLTLARPELWGSLTTSAEWDTLVDAGASSRVSGLEIHTSILRFGNHARP